MAKLDFSNPFDPIPTWYYADSDTPYTAIWGQNVVKDTKYNLPNRCKQIVHPEDGGKPYRCKLGVWTKHPKDELCYMHHPKVDFRGGAAKRAIERGDMTPKTASARERLTLAGKPRKRMGRPPKKKKVEEIKGDKVVCRVSFVEHKVLEDGELAQAEGEVGFANEDLADGFATLLSHTTPSNPLLNEDSLYFYTNVKLKLDA